MNILLFLFIGLFALSSFTVARILIKKRKRLREAEKDLQLHRTELEAFALKLKAQEENISLQKQELEAKENILKKEAELIIQERENLDAFRKKLDTEAEKTAEEQAMLEKKMQEHFTREKQLQDILAELESKSKHLATFEESLKNTSEELTEKDLKLTARKEELEVRNAELMREKQELDARDVELKAFQDELKSEKEEIEHKIAEITEDKKKLMEEHAALRIARENVDRLMIELAVRTHDLKAMESEITAQKQEIAAKEDALKKEADALVQERENLAAIRQELNTEAERIAGASAMLNAKEQEHIANEKELTDVAAELKTRSEQSTVFEERLKETSEDLTASGLKLTAWKEELEARAAAIVREKEELDTREAELKALQNELKSEHDKLEQRDNELKEFHERLTSKEKSLYSQNELKIGEDEFLKKVEVVKNLLTKLSGEQENIENERRLLEEKIADIERRESALIECDRSLKSKEEEARRRTQEEEEREAVDDLREKAVKGPLAPGKRGGRPRGQPNESEKEQGFETKPRSLKPEIICWKEGWSWVIGIEVPEELESLSVTQNEELLERDNIDESRYHLKQADGIVKVTWTGGAKVISVMEPKSNYLIFKMRKNWIEPGRLVQRSTNGYYLIVAPQEWERDKEISGDAPVNPESTQLEGYKAYFFYKEQKLNNTVGFIAANGDRIQVESGSPRFQLVGNEITDASEDMGPLFGGQPPSIQSLGEKGWSNVEVIVVGEEGKGRNRWRTQFSPQLAEKEQKLPEELRSRHGGWYFVRIYDNDDNLLESMDFRFMEGLKDIKVHSYSFLPGPSGHQPVRVEFLHKPRSHIQLVKGNPESLQIKHEDELMSAIIPSHPAWDVTDWEIRCDRQKVIVEIMIERIWWNLTEDDSLPATELLDSPLSIRHDSINATSNTAILLWFPKPRWIQTILVGFEKSKSRPYSVEVNDRKIRIPLREFSDADEIENKTQQVLLRLWLVDRNTLEDGIVICEILSKKEPTPIPPEGPIQPVIEPDQMPCCNTCDHARTHHNNYWCRRYHWTQVSASEFTEKFERFKCAEWRGEYFNAKHKYWKR